MMDALREDGNSSNGSTPLQHASGAFSLTDCRVLTVVTGRGHGEWACDECRRGMTMCQRTYVRCLEGTAPLPPIHTNY